MYSNGITLIEQLLDLEADMQADIDGFVESKSDEFADRLRNLLLSANERNPSTWEAFDAHPTLTLIDYGLVEIHSRGPQWTAEVSTMVAAARAQAWIEVHGLEYLATINRHADEITAHARTMSTADLKAAAVQGVGKARYNGAIARKNSANQ